MERKEAITILPNNARTVADYLRQTAPSRGVSVQVTSLPSGLAVVTETAPTC